MRKALGSDNAFGRIVVSSALDDAHYYYLVANRVYIVEARGKLKMQKKSFSQFTIVNFYSFAPIQTI